MKVCVIQPKYSYNGSDLAPNFEALLSMLDECDPSLDLIVLPEYSDIPADPENQTDFLAAIQNNGPRVLRKASETAKRCGATVFCNAMSLHEGGYRNTTYAFDRAGNEIGRYYKAHPAPSEVRSAEQGGHGLDVDYSYDPAEPYVLECEGLRFGFLTCYDFYFYENFPQLARRDLDIIIGCSLQRTDRHETLETIHRFLCYNTNAYLIRASVSLGEDSPICGCSTVVAPSGEVLLDMKSRVGLGTLEIDPTAKHEKPAGFGGKSQPHHRYVEVGRRPWLYRPGGAAIARYDDIMPYPRVCAHRGYSTVAPENTMPAFGAAVALGAEEIEFDLWATSDGVIVSCHDDTLDRVSNGHGKIYEHTYEELAALDFGGKHDPRFAGLSIATFEDILRRLACQTVMNIHVKIWDCEQEKDYLEDIVALIRKYDCARHVYFMTSSDRMLRRAKEYAPDIVTCVGWNGDKEPRHMLDRAISLGADKIQWYKPYYTPELMKEAHEHGIINNIFWSDDPDEAISFLEMGVDTLLANNYLPVRNAVNAWKKK